MLKVIAPLVYLLLCVCVLSVPAHAASSAHPNILLLVADDLGYNDSGIYQDIFQQKPVASMPALESLAKQGVRFTRFYTESTCSASRAALITGQYPARNGFMPVARGISSEVVTLPEYLRSQGYATHLVGKWHVGEVNHPAFPQYQGFDTVFGFLGQWFLKGPDKNGQPELKSPTYHNPWLLDVKSSSQSSYKQHQGHLEDLLTTRSVDLIRNTKHGKQSWFIYHAFFAPHTPLEPADDFASRFDNTPEGKHKAMLAQLDDSVLQILSALKESGQWDNTIIIFLSDNGSSHGKGPSEKRTNSNAPFSGTKAEYEEGGIRTPLVIKWDKAHAKQETRTDVVSIMDIYPSLVSTISNDSASLKKLDGISSLLPVNPQLRTTPLYFLTYGSLSVLSADGRYRLLREWDAEHFIHTQLFEYDKNNLPIDVSLNWFEKRWGKYTKISDALFGDFIQWRNQLRIVPLHINNSVITGSDFLRVPINPSWAMAFSFTITDANKKQTLLHQQNAIEVTLENGNLSANVNGLVVQKNNIQAHYCYSIVLSGEFYDRFSGVQNDIRTSQLHLIVNGKAVDTTSGQINSFESVDITEPVHMENISKLNIYSTQLLPNDEPIPSDFDEAIKDMCP